MISNYQEIHFQPDVIERMAAHFLRVSGDDILIDGSAESCEESRIRLALGCLDSDFGCIGWLQDLAQINNDWEVKSREQQDMLHEQQIQESLIVDLSFCFRFSELSVTLEDEQRSTTR